MSENKNDNHVMISIFIPVYNGAKYLPETLDCVLSQTYSNLEVLCVDDSSTDDSGAILKTYAKRDSRIRVFTKPNEGSVPPSWNFVIPHLKGEFTLYMSQDDLLEHNSIELMVTKQKETGADTVMANEFLYYGPEKESWIPIGIPTLMNRIIDGKDALRLMIDYQIPGFALWKTEIIKNVGVFSETYNGDELAQRQWIAKSKKVAFSQGVFFYRCNNPQSITRSHQLHYESVLTDAMLLLFIEKELAGEDTLIGELGNDYFTRLYMLMIMYLQHRHEYSKSERKRIMPFFLKTYRILRNRESLTNWKFRLSKINYILMWLVVLLKTIQYSNKHEGTINRIEIKPIHTPRKYLNYAYS